MCSISPVSPPSYRNQEHAQNHELTPLRSVLGKRSIENDTCFSCKGKGHWAAACPSKIQKLSPSSSSCAMNDADLPDIHCPCGAGRCLILVSKKPSNPDRKFYRCPYTRSPRDCSFFKWCDTLSFHLGPNFIETSYPTCPCGAGKCILLTEENGSNVGRKFFACPVKKGQGACTFSQFLDLPGEGCKRDETVIEVQVPDKGDSLQHSEQRESRFTYPLSGPSEGVTPDREPSGVHFGVQSDSTEDEVKTNVKVSVARVLFPCSELEETRDASLTPGPSRGEIPETDTFGSHLNVQLGSSFGDSLTGPMIEGDDSYVDDILLSAARHFANDFLIHIRGLSVPSLLSKKKQLKKAIEKVSNFGVDCSAFVSQLENIIHQIEECEALLSENHAVGSLLAEQGVAIERLRDQLSLIDSKEACQKERLEIIRSRLHDVDQAEDDLTDKRIKVLQELATTMEGLQRLASERQQLLSELAAVEREAQFKLSRAELLEQIEQAEKEHAKLEMECCRQAQLYDKLMVSLKSLQPWN